MLINSAFTTKDSIKFLLEIIKSNTQPLPSKSLKIDGQEADFYQTEKLNKKNRTIVFFHGYNQLGNKDQRIVKIAGAFTAIGFDCLVPKIPCYTEIRIPQEPDFHLLSSFLNYLLVEKLITNNPLLFIGPSTSCLALLKVAGTDELRAKVKSICLISPYFNSKRNHKNLLEKPRNLYGQLVSLKLILYSQFLHEKSASLRYDLHVLNKAINLCYLKKNERNIDRHITEFISSELHTNSQLLELINNLGKPGFITDKLHPFLIDISGMSTYQNCLEKVDAKIAIIHSSNDDIFPPRESILLSKLLNKKNMNHRLVITSLLEHADINLKNIIKELIPMVKAFNYFFKQ